MADIQQQLIWLGAGNATVPANLIAKAGKAVLVDARADACAALVKQFTGQSHVRVLHSLISEHGGDVSFTEYNLAEFSALHSSTGLSSLFPGLKPVKSQQQHSETVAALLQPLALSGDDNILVVDIADISLLLLKQLQAAKLLAHFSQVYVQSSAEALYQGAATQGELSQWLQQQGYNLSSQDTTDPDLPWLQFSLNPLWQTIQQSQAKQAQAEQAKAELTKQLEQLKQQAEENNKKNQQQALEQKHQFEQKLAELNTTLVNNVSEKETLQQQLTAVKVAAEKKQAELSGLIASKDAELKQALQQLETANQHLSSANEKLKQQVQAAEQQKIALTKENEALRQQVSQLNTQQAELQAKHTELADKHTKLQQHSEHRIGELKTALAKAEQGLKDTQAQLAEVQPKLQDAQQKLQQAAQQASLEKLLDDKLNALAAAKTDELNKAVNNIKNHVNTGLGNSAKQLEAFMGIQSYLEKGIKPLSFHGWPISPDIGLYIAGLIDANNYDVIIEFGSGTSTVLMAKALLSKQRGITQKMLSEKHAKPSNELMIAEGEYNDLPARIVTFEHNSKYHTQTLKALQDNGVDHLVDLVHAPLVDYQYKDGSQYLYYSCADKLAELAKVFKGRKANILVLVDGPPGATNKNARFPALPHLLNELSQHAFAIIMDDYNRAEEKEVVELWKKIATERSLNPSVDVIQSEKGLAVLTLQ